MEQNQTNQTPLGPVMPQSGPVNNPSQMRVLPIIAVAVLLIGALMFFMQGGNNNLSPNDDEDTQGNNESLEIKETQAVNGFISAPPGLPSDIPVENSSIVESATTNYPNSNTSQLSLSYTSSKTVAQKYAEYKTYMTSNGYKITESGASSPVRAIFGTKTDANLSVAISTSGGKTLVQLSYLLK